MRTATTIAIAATFAGTASPAVAQRLAYAVSSAGPPISLSRCAVAPGSCRTTIYLIDIDQARVIGSWRTDDEGSDGQVAISTDGALVAWPTGWGASLKTLNRETLTSAMAAAGTFRTMPRISASAAGRTFFVYEPLQEQRLWIVGEAPQVKNMPLAARSLATNAGGTRAYASTDAGITVIDVAQATVEDTVALAGMRGWDIAMSPDDSALYALRSPDASGSAATLFKLDPVTLSVVAERSLPFAGDLRVTPDGQHLWVSNGNLDVSVPAAERAVRSLHADTLADRSLVPVGEAVWSVALSGDGQRVLVSTFNSLIAIDTVNSAVVATAAAPSLTRVVALPAGAPCVFLVAQAAFQVGAAGGTVQAGVPAPAGCAWSASSTDAWLGPVAPPAAVGAGSVTITAAANASSQPRTGSVIVAGQTITITQAAPPQTPGTPGPPQGLAASVLPGAFARLTWSAPAAGPAPTGFVVEAGSLPGAQDIVVAPVGLLTTVTGGPLAPGPYYVRVRAVNAVGGGPSSADVSFVIQPIPPQPFIDGLTWTTPQSGRLSWGFNPAATSMRIWVGHTPDLADVGMVEVSNALPYVDVTATTLPPGRYFVRLTGVNANGISGPPSNAAEVWFGSACSAAPQGPASLTMSGGPFVTVSATTTSFQPFMTYRFYVGTAPGASNVAIVDSPVSPLSGFLPSGTYYIRAAFVNACGVSAPTPERVLTIP